MRCAVADRATASTANVFSESRGGHEVSILKRVAGLCRGAAPRSNTSMMIMRPPQHGQGCESGSSSWAGSGRLVLWLWRGEQLAGARDICGAGGACEQTIVADAVEAVRQHVDEEAAGEQIRRR